METIQLELHLAIEQLNIELARNATQPDITFGYSYTTRTESGSIGQALGHLASNSFPDHSISLSAAIPIGNKAAKARLDRARLVRLRTLTAREQLQQEIRQQAHEAVNELRKNWRLILAAEQGVTAAYRQYEVEQSQFQLGKQTSTEVLRAAGALADAQMRKISAFAEYEIAKVNLAFTTGTLLGYGRIQLQPINIGSE